MSLVSFLLSWRREVPIFLSKVPLPGGLYPLPLPLQVVPLGNLFPFCYKYLSPRLFSTLLSQKPSFDPTTTCSYHSIPLFSFNTKCVENVGCLPLPTQLPQVEFIIPPTVMWLTFPQLSLPGMTINSLISNPKLRLNLHTPWHFSEIWHQQDSLLLKIHSSLSLPLLHSVSLDRLFHSTHIFNVSQFAKFPSLVLFNAFIQSPRLEVIEEVLYRYIKKLYLLRSTLTHLPQKVRNKNELQLF